MPDLLPTGVGCVSDPGAASCKANLFFLKISVGSASGGVWDDNGRGRVCVCELVYIYVHMNVPLIGTLHH